MHFLGDRSLMANDKPSWLVMGLGLLHKDDLG